MTQHLTNICIFCIKQINIVTQTLRSLSHEIMKSHKTLILILS